MDRFDVIVLGAGIIGASLADELARRGRRVCLLERGAVGGEASKAAAGILSAQMDVDRPGPFFEMCQASRRLYPAWVRKIEAGTGMSVGHLRQGVLYLALTAVQAARMEQRRRWQERQGLQVERWSPAEVRRQEPAVDGRLVAGFYFPAESQVDNAKLMDALAGACRRSGVVVRAGTEASALLVRSGKVAGVSAAGRAIKAPVVVDCLGCWAPLDRGRRRQVLPARGQILEFDAPKRLLRRPVMAEPAYGVQRADGRLLVGSTIEFAGYDKHVTLEGMLRILRGFSRFVRSGALKQCRFRQAWSGLRPYSVDHRPVLGRTAVEGLFAAFGHFRHGILLAPITAQILAELILTGRSRFDLAPFSPARFSRAP